MVHVSASPVKTHDGRSERWRAHKQARRQEFVDAALTAVRSKGAGVALDDVCAVAKVSKPVIYRHFRDKDDLFAAVLQQIATEVFLPRIASQLDPALDDWAMMRAAIGAYVALVSEEPQLYRFVFAYSGVGERGDFVGSMESAIAQALGEMMAERLESAGRPAGAGEPMAYAMVGMVQLATHRWVDHPTIGADELVELLSEVAWQGLAGSLPRPEA